MRARARFALLTIVAALVVLWWRESRRRQQFTVSPSGLDQPFPFAAVARPERAATTAWIVPDGDVPPASHPVKVKTTSGIYHQPGSSNYARTRADRWYRDTATAQADGFRAAKN